MHLIEDKTILIVGLGLIGGSVARGLAAARACRRILACGREEGPLHTALLDGSIHGYDTDLRTLAPQADIILITTPTLTVPHVLTQLRDCVRDDTVITDAASVKASVVDDARRILAGSVSRFVAGHPIAGSEQSGYAASRADLYRQRKVILTPIAENSTVALQMVMQLWQALGADLHAMSASQHDKVLAGTSHLPHLLAYTLVNTLVDAVGEADRSEQVFDYAAGGFADFSRIASSDPVMWRDIFLANRDATVSILDAYVDALQHMKTLLLRADGKALQDSFDQARQTRNNFIRRFRAGQSSLTERVEPVLERWRVRPSIRIAGECRLAAAPAVAARAIDQMLADGGVWAIAGVPEDRQTLIMLQGLRDAGIPVSGPEHGQVLLFGPQMHNNTRSQQLPANPALLGLLALAVSGLPGSEVRVCAALPAENPLPALLKAFQELGLTLTADAGDLIITHPGTLLSGRARLDVPGDALSDTELLLLITAGLLCDAPLEICMAAEAAQRLAPRLQVWSQQLGGMSVNAATVVVDPAQRHRLSGQLHCAEDAELALVVSVLAAAGNNEVTVISASDVRSRYPGLLMLLERMGIDLKDGCKELTGVD